MDLFHPGLFTIHKLVRIVVGGWSDSEDINRNNHDNGHLDYVESYDYYTTNGKDDTPLLPVSGFL